MSQIVHHVSELRETCPSRTPSLDFHGLKNSPHAAMKGLVVSSLERDGDRVEPSSRSGFWIEHDLFGKPLHIFPDPAWLQMLRYAVAAAELGAPSTTYASSPFTRYRNALSPISSPVAVFSLTRPQMVSTDRPSVFFRMARFMSPNSSDVGFANRGAVVEFALNAENSCSIDEPAAVPRQANPSASVQPCILTCRGRGGQLQPTHGRDQHANKKRPHASSKRGRVTLAVLAASNNDGALVSYNLRKTVKRSLSVSASLCEAPSWLTLMQRAMSR